MRNEEKQQLIEKYVQTDMLNKPIDNEGNTIIHKLAEKGDVEMLSFLYEKGADVTKKNDSLTTPLMLASLNWKTKAMEFILSVAPSTVNEKNSRGMTALHFTLTLGMEKQARDSIDLLVAKGADINTKTNTGVSLIAKPLMSADLSMLSFLIDKGLDIDGDFKIPNYVQKYTPLTYAIEKYDDKLFQFFLEEGANPNKKNLDGKTPLGVAVEYLSITPYVAKNVYIKYIETLLRFGADKSLVNGFDTMIKSEISKMQEYREPIVITAMKKEDYRLDMIRRMMAFSGRVKE